MLSEEEIERAEDEAAQPYREDEAAIVALLAAMLAAHASTGAGSDFASIAAGYDAAAVDAAASSGAQRRRDAVLGAVDAGLRASDAEDMARCGVPASAQANPTRPGDAPKAGAASERAAVELRERLGAGLDMPASAREAYLAAASHAVALVQSGQRDVMGATIDAARQLARRGLEVVTYGDGGRPTRRDHVDVAVRRAVRTELVQLGADMTAERIRELGMQLVEVSAHFGARPTHAVWQGGVYGLDGPCVVDGTAYRGLAEATGYGEVDGLCGVNCRHMFGVYAPGMPLSWEGAGESHNGLTNSEQYEAVQRQHAIERSICSAKRELKAMEAVDAQLGTPETAREVERARALVRGRQQRMRDYIDGVNARCIPGTEALQRRYDLERV